MLPRCRGRPTRRPLPALAAAAPASCRRAGRGGSPRASPRSPGGPPHRRRRRRRRRPPSRGPGDVAVTEVGGDALGLTQQRVTDPAAATAGQHQDIAALREHVRDLAVRLLDAAGQLVLERHRAVRGQLERVGVAHVVEVAARRRVAAAEPARRHLGAGVESRAAHPVAVVDQHTPARAPGRRASARGRPSWRPAVAPQEHAPGRRPRGPRRRRIPQPVVQVSRSASWPSLIVWAPPPAPDRVVEVEDHRRRRRAGWGRTGRCPGNPSWCWPATRPRSTGSSRQRQRLAEHVLGELAGPHPDLGVGVGHRRRRDRVDDRARLAELDRDRPPRGRR